MKRQNGITLIALVITIIVLVVLAGVSLSLAIGENGILNQAVNGRNKYEIAEEIEKIKIAATTAHMKGSYEKINKNYLKEELDKEFGESNYSLSDANDGFNIFVKKGYGRTYYLANSGTVIQIDNITDNNDLLPELKLVANTGRSIIVEVLNTNSSTYSYKFSTDGENWTEQNNNMFSVETSEKTATYTVPGFGLEEMGEPVVSGTNSNVTIYAKIKKINR